MAHMHSTVGQAVFGQHVQAHIHETLLSDVFKLLQITLMT